MQKKNYTAEFKKLGKKVKKLRESNKMTQQSLSDFCDVDIRTIQRIEVGEMRFSIRILFALAEAFGVKVEELFLE